MKIPGVYCKFSLLFFSAYTRENFYNFTTTHGKISTSCPWCLGNFLELFHGAWHNQFSQLSLVNLIQERRRGLREKRKKKFVFGAEEKVKGKADGEVKVEEIKDIKG
jgi:hypothetical protein